MHKSGNGSVLRVGRDKTFVGVTLFLALPSEPKMGRSRSTGVWRSGGPYSVALKGDRTKLQRSKD